MFTQVANQDLSTLFICSVRYCLGRKTYMPSLIQSIVKTHSAVLTEHDCIQIAKEVDEHLDYLKRKDDSQLSFDFDSKDWAHFRDWLRQLALSKKNTL